MGVYLTCVGRCVVVKGGIGDRGIAEGVGPCVRYRQRQGEGRGERDEWVSGGRKMGWPERAVADRGRLTQAAAETLVSLNPIITLSPIAVRTYVHQVEKKNHKNVRDEIQQVCVDYTDPSQGWSHQALAGRSTLRAQPPFFFLIRSPNPYLATPQPSVLQLLQARCVLQGAITGHLGPHFPGAYRI
jgi:hypothetical protein